MPHRSAPPCNRPQHGTPRHDTAQHNKARRGTAQPASGATARHTTARHGAARHDRAQRTTTQHRPAQRSTAKNSTTQHGAPKHTTAPKRETLTVGLTRSSRLIPRKGRKRADNRGTKPYQPAMHRLGAKARPSVTPLHRRWRPARTNRHQKVKTGSAKAGGHGKPQPRLTEGLRKPVGATAQPGELEPNLTGQATRPSVYITHPTHGAGALPSQLQHQQQPR